MRGKCVSYRARGVAWSIYTEDDQLLDLRDRIFDDLRAAPVTGATAFEIRRTNERGHFALVQDGHETTIAGPAVFDELVGYLNRAVLAHSANTIDLHGTALASPDCATTIVATGPSGSGKTTLAAHLCRAGWSYLSDETVGVRIDDGTLVGCGKPLTIKPGLHATLGLDLTPLTIDADIQRRWYVRPALLGGSITRRASQPTDLVFVDFDAAKTDTVLRAVAPTQAVARLLPNTFRLDRRNSDVAPTLARLVAGARLWELRTGDMADGITKLLDAVSLRPLERRSMSVRSVSEEPKTARGPAPAIGTFCVSFDSGAAIYDPKRSQVVVLDSIGARVWDRLDQGQSIATIVADLSAEFDAPIATIAADVERACTELTATGFLAVDQVNASSLATAAPRALQKPPSHAGLELLP